MATGGDDVRPKETREKQFVTKNLRMSIERDQVRRIFLRAGANYERYVDEKDLVNATIEFDFIKEKYSLLEDLSNKIVQQMLDNYNEEEFTREVEESEKYRHNFSKYKVKFEILKETMKPRVDTPNANISTTSACQHDKLKLHLPKIEIRKFNDDPKSWVPFWSQYKKIHENKDLHEEDKFQYLIQAMEPRSKARDIVESYSPSAANYKKVIEVLKDRFAREEILIEIYVRDLIKLVIVKHSLSLDLLYDKILANLQTLETLGINRDKYECILFPLIESALPDSTLLMWSRTVRSNQSKLTQLLAFLREEVKAEERIKLAKTDLVTGTGIISDSVVPTAACLVAETQGKGELNTRNKGNDVCLFCEKKHNSVECSKKLTLDEKKDLIKKKGACFFCLKRGHMAKACKTFVNCINCSRRHVVVMCPGLHGDPQESKTKTVQINNSLTCNNTSTLLQTLIVVISNGNKNKEVRILLDSGSQRTYIKTGLAEELGLEVEGTECLGHSLFGGQTKQTEEHRLIKFKISNLKGSYQTVMTGLEMNVLCGYLPKVRDVNLINRLQSNNITLTDAQKHSITDISILIGSDFLGSILETEIIHVTDSLVALKTKLGWTIQGPMQGVYSSSVKSLFVSTLHAKDSLDFLWDIETLGIKDPYEKIDLRKNEIFTFFNDNLSVNQENRYEVGLIWKIGYPELNSNYNQAYKRLQSTSKRLETTGKMKDYHEIFQEWKKENIIERIHCDDTEEGHYLPHHPVIKMESTTTKIRPVFNASTKDKNNNSLNECIEKGPNLIEMIPKLLIKFRAGKYGVTADIKKAFLQISVKPQDRKYLKMLWWDNPHKKDKIVTYQHTRVPFGVACSPFLLAATLSYHIQKQQNQYTDTAYTLKECFYVDNVVTSFDSKNEVEKFKEEAIDIMKKGKFDLRGWMMTGDLVDEPTSILGLKWNRKRDDLQCELNVKHLPVEITKRHLLSITQQLFDPLGFLSPVTLVPKLITQKAWLLNTGWDEQITADLKKEYTDWINKVHFIDECKIPRQLSTHPLRECETSVHVFCDASKTAYAGCVFLRTKKNDKVTVQLIISKSRVAPIKRQMSLPRLELMGALVASRLYNEVINSGIFAACKDYKMYCWTDSSVVWAWLHRQEQWKPFVSNRIKEICMNTNKDNWYHLPGTVNPADLPSRGCTAETLLETQWWMGPQWLYLEPELWPKSNISTLPVDENEISNERRKITAVHVETNTIDFTSKLLYFNQFRKIVYLVARLQRMNPRIRNKYNWSTTHIGNEEYQDAEKTIIKLIQRESYTNENKINKKFNTIEKEGILRVKTRLELCYEDQDFIYPILLPGKHEIVQRLVRDNHITLKHAGTQIMMSTLRNKYWITGIRRLTKKIVSQCVVCKRYKAKHYQAPQPPLPTNRVSCTAAFEITGIDLAGPLILKNKDKCWIILFTCAVYRAIHLELTDSLSTAAFVMALRRFIARRGRIKTIYSDNGTNFQGTANLLREVNWQEVETSTRTYNIVWKFSPPAAPWWGGWWERLIRVIKEMLRRNLGKASIDWIELSTILCDCEAIINTRPLTYIEMDGTKPLTPMMFLHSLPTSDTSDLDQIDHKNLNIRHRYLQKLREDFRTRFRNEYLSLLINTGKEQKKEPKVGEIVLIETEANRLTWPLGIIKEIFIGRDGYTRVAKVKTATGEKIRAYQSLYPLEVSATSPEWQNMTEIGKSQFSLIDHQDQAQASTATPPVRSDDIMEQNSGTKVITIPTTRSGREVKLPTRFLD